MPKRGATKGDEKAKKRQREEEEEHALAGGLPPEVWNIILFFFLEVDWYNRKAFPRVCASLCSLYRSLDKQRFLYYLGRNEKHDIPRNPILTFGYCNAFGHLLVNYMEKGIVKVVRGCGFFLAKVGDSYLLKMDHFAIPGCKRRGIVMTASGITSVDVDETNARIHHNPQSVTKKQLVDSLPRLLNQRGLFRWRSCDAGGNPERLADVTYKMEISEEYSTAFSEHRLEEPFPWFDGIIRSGYEFQKRLLSFSPEVFVALLQRPRDTSGFAFAGLDPSLGKWIEKSTDFSDYIYQTMVHLRQGSGSLW